MLARLRSFWRGLRHRAEVERELDDEMRFHLEARAEHYVREGMSLAEARRRARLEFGAVDKAKEETREARGVSFFDSLAQDLRFGGRMLRKSPGFTVAVTLTLALGVGANILMSSVVYQLLFRVPGDLTRPEEIMRVDSIGKDGHPQMELAHYPGFRQLSDHTHFLELAAESFPFATDFGRGSAAREVQRNYISHSYFDVLGTKLLMGRPFTFEEETQTGGEAAAVVSYDFWKSELAGDPKALSRAVWIEGRPHAVVGITPKGFTGLSLHSTDVWLPLSDGWSEPGRDPLTDKARWWLQVIGRPIPGTTMKEAADEATAAFHNAGGDRQNSIRVEPFLSTFAAETSASQAGRVALWLLLLAALVFLIAWVNVTNLFLARAVQRRQEMAVRMQLGAGRSRILRQVTVENLMVSGLGGMAALLLSYWVRPFVSTVLFSSNTHVGDFLSWKLAGLGAFLAALVGIAGGLWAMPDAGRESLPQSLGLGRTSHENSKLRAALVVAEVGFTLLLSVGATLFVRSLRNVYDISLGFDPSHILVATASTSGYESADVDAEYERMRLRAKSIPGIEGAAAASSIPFLGYSLSTYWVPATSSSPARMVNGGFAAVTSDYFAVMGMRILRGRSFLASEGRGAPPVAIVNESMAREVAPNGDAIGKCIMTYDKKFCLEIVGVIPDERRQFLFDDAPGQPKGSVFTTLSQQIENSALFAHADGLLLRTRGNPSPLERAIGSELASVAADSRYVSVQPITKFIYRDAHPFQMGAKVLSLFAVLALVLAAVGISGLLGYTVKRRTSEIGLRLALGAMPGDVMALVMRRGMLLVLAGIGIGVPTTLGLARLMRSLLYGIAPTDWVSYGVAIGVVVAVAIVACYVPARRAMRVDPMVALRHE